MQSGEYLARCATSVSTSLFGEIFKFDSEEYSLFSLKKKKKKKGILSMIDCCEQVTRVYLLRFNYQLILE